MKAKKFEIFCGLQNKDGEISDMAFADFLEDVVTPLFSDGLSVYAILGQWKCENGIIATEKTKVIMLIVSGGVTKQYNWSTVENDIENIATAYKDQFAQKSVMVLVSDVDVSF